MIDLKTITLGQLVEKYNKINGDDDLFDEVNDIYEDMDTLISKQTDNVITDLEIEIMDDGSLHFDCRYSLSYEGTVITGTFEDTFSFDLAKDWTLCDIINVFTNRVNEHVNEQL